MIKSRTKAVVYIVYWLTKKFTSINYVYETILCKLCIRPPWFYFLSSRFGKILTISLNNLQIQLHRAMCGDVEVQCDACGDLCKRSNITTHLTTSCPDTLTCCPYAEFGCSDKCRRADMEQHVRNSTQLHLQVFFFFFLFCA